MDRVKLLFWRGALILGLPLLVGVFSQAEPLSGVIQIKDCPASQVAFNEASLKYHTPSCLWVKRCTVNCICLPLSEAQRRGGVPCKVCVG